MVTVNDWGILRSVSQTFTSGCLTINCVSPRSGWDRFPSYLINRDGPIKLTRLDILSRRLVASTRVGNSLGWRNIDLSLIFGVLWTVWIVRIDWRIWILWIFWRYRCRGVVVVYLDIAVFGIAINRYCLNRRFIRSRVAIVSQVRWYNLAPAAWFNCPIAVGNFTSRLVVWNRPGQSYVLFNWFSQIAWNGFACLFIKVLDSPFYGLGFSRSFDIISILGVSNRKGFFWVVVSCGKATGNGLIRRVTWNFWRINWGEFIASPRRTWNGFASYLVNRDGPRNCASLNVVGWRLIASTNVVNGLLNVLRNRSLIFGVLWTVWIVRIDWRIWILWIFWRDRCRGVVIVNLDIAVFGIAINRFCCNRFFIWSRVAVVSQVWWHYFIPAAWFYRPVAIGNFTSYFVSINRPGQSYVLFNRLC